MEGGMLLGASCVSGFICVFASVSALQRGLARAHAAVMVQSAVSGDFGERGRRSTLAAMAHYYVRNGIPSFDSLGRAVLKRAGMASVLSDATSLLRRRGWDATRESLASLSVAAICLSSAVGLVVFKTFVAAVSVPICLTLVSVIALSQGRAKEQELLRDQVPDALRCMEACLHAGLSLPQAFSEVAAEIDQPLKESFAQVSRDIDLGFSVQDALSRFHRNAGLDELGFVAMALDVQYVCGGSATPVLRSAQDSIARGLDLRRSLRVQTAQARLSAQVVSVLPVFLPAVLSLVSPGFLSPFFASSYGVAMLALAACMQIAGVVMVRRMLDVRL